MAGELNRTHRPLSLRERLLGAATPPVDAEATSIRRRLIQVRGEALVGSAKARAMDAVGATVMVGTANLTHLRAALAGDDPLLADDLAVIARVASGAKLEILANTAGRLSDEGLIQ